MHECLSLKRIELQKIFCNSDLPGLGLHYILAEKWIFCPSNLFNSSQFGQCYQPINVMNQTLHQSHHIKRLPLFFIFYIFFCFGVSHLAPFILFLFNVIAIVYGPLDHEPRTSTTRPRQLAQRPPLFTQTFPKPPPRKFKKILAMLMDIVGHFTQPKTYFLL